MTRITHKDCHCCRAQRESVGIEAQPNTALCVTDTDGAAGVKDLEVLERAIGLPGDVCQRDLAGRWMQGGGCGQEWHAQSLAFLEWLS